MNRLALFILLALVAAAVIAHAASPLPQAGGNVWEKWVTAYRYVAELSEAGLNVSEYVQELREALQLIDQGDYGRAEEVTNQLLASLQQLSEEREAHAFLDTAGRYAAAAAVLSLPALFYYLFPRVYLWVWYSLRRRWVISEKG